MYYIVLYCIILYLNLTRLSLCQWHAFWHSVIKPILYCIVLCLPESPCLPWCVYKFEFTYRYLVMIDKPSSLDGMTRIWNYFSIQYITGCVYGYWPCICDGVCFCRWQYGSIFNHFFTARCTLVQSAVLRSHVVCLSLCPSVCDVGGSGSHRSVILETNCTDT